MSDTLGTPQTVNYLLTDDFQDGQATGSIVPSRIRDLIATFASATFVSVMQYGATGNGTTNDTCFLVACTGSQLLGCEAYSGTGTVEYTGYQIGISGSGAVGNILRGCWANDCATAVLLEVDGGYNDIDVMCSQASGVLFSGTASACTELKIKSDGTLPTDGTSSTGGNFQIQRLATTAFTISDNDYNDIFNVDTTGKEIDLVNGTNIHGYSDEYGTTSFLINGSTGMASVVLCALPTTQTISANAATIVVGNFGKTTISTTAARTGLILAAGTTDGQEFTIINNSAYALSWNTTDATSRVKTGTSNGVAADVAVRYTWDTASALWWKN